MCVRLLFSGEASCSRCRRAQAHTCHETSDEALKHLELAWRGYLRVMNGVLGMTGLRLRRPDWDRFAGAEHTGALDAGVGERGCA